MAQPEEEAGPSAVPNRAAGNKAKADESRKLRSEYRAFQKTVHRDGDDLVSINKSSKLLGYLDNLNSLNTRVEGPREQAEDTEIFYVLCQKGAEAARRVIGAGKGRTPNDLIRALKSEYVSTANPQEDGANIPETFNWKALAQLARMYFKHAPGVSCMLGPMDAAPKVRKVTVRQPKKPLAALVNPVEVQIPETSKEQTDANMTEMLERLQERNNVNVLQCIINHKSFSQSVENLFALSSAVSNAFVTLSRAPGGGYNVTAISKEESSRLAKGKERTQAIFGFDMDTWDDWCTRVRPEDCIMVHRPPAVLPGTAAAPPPPAGGGAAGGSGLQASRKRAPSRRPTQEEESEEEEEDEDEEAARARARKGKKKIRDA